MPPCRMFYEAARIRKMLRRCDMYVVRLLPDPNNNPNPNRAVLRGQCEACQAEA
mgnify:CR=1 FL=1